jgi:hypothetical protein
VLPSINIGLLTAQEVSLRLTTLHYSSGDTSRGFHIAKIRHCSNQYESDAGDGPWKIKERL